MDTERLAGPVQWYNALLVIELQHPDEPLELELTTERRVIVLRARSDEEALSKAMQQCESLKPDAEYLNQYGHRVRWLRVTEVDFDHNIAVVMGKGSRPRAVPSASARPRPSTVISALGRTIPTPRTSGCGSASRAG